MLQLKELIQAKIEEAVTYRQKLIVDFKGAGTGTTLDDKQYLSNYPTIKNNSILYLIIQPPICLLYIQDQAEKVHEIEIPSKEPEVRARSGYLRYIFLQSFLELSFD